MAAASAPVLRAPHGRHRPSARPASHKPTGSWPTPLELLDIRNASCKNKASLRRKVACVIQDQELRRTVSPAPLVTGLLLICKQAAAHQVLWIKRPGNALSVCLATSQQRVIRAVVELGKGAHHVCQILRAQIQHSLLRLCCQRLQAGTAQALAQRRISPQKVGLRAQSRRVTDYNTENGPKHVCASLGFV